jgi:SAM-dependent methyltransferase
MSGWSRLHEAVQSGKPVRPASSTTDDAEQRESFLLGMFNLAMNLAPQLVPRIDLGGRRRLLDLGGGPGTYAAHFCLANPDLQSVVFDLPTTRPFAEKTIARFGLAERVTFVEGDYLSDEIPGSYDVVWLSHILHGEGLEGCKTIIDKAVRSLQPGGMIIIQDFILDDDGCGPIFPALFSLNMLVATEAGRSYSEGELKGLLATAGVGTLRRIPHDLPGHTGLISGIIQ